MLESSFKFDTDFVDFPVPNQIDLHMHMSSKNASFLHSNSSWVAQEGKASRVALLRRIRDGEVSRVA